MTMKTETKADEQPLSTRGSKEPVPSLLKQTQAKDAGEKQPLTKAGENKMKEHEGYIQTQIKLCQELLKKISKENYLDRAEYLNKLSDYIASMRAHNWTIFYLDKDGKTGGRE